MKFKQYILLFLFFVSFAFASKPLTIVYNGDTPPLKFTDEKGNANGMLIDIWKLWAKKNNINITFKELPWDETIRAIKDGSADIHGGIYYTKDRDKFLEYPNKALYANKKYFFYYKRIEQVNTINDLKPFVIGIDNGFPIDYMKGSFPTYSIKLFSSANEVSKAFVNGDVKVMLASYATFMYYLKEHNIDETNFKFSQRTFAYEKDYFGAVKQGNEKLLNLINKGFEKISDEELSDIEKKWTSKIEINYLKDHSGIEIFDQYQKDYIKQKKQIKMCVDPNWLPFETIKDGKHVGMVADIYEHFKKELNLPIKLVETKTWAQSLDNAKNKKCDILSAAAITPQRLEYLNFTKPYLKFPQVLVTREKEKFIEDFNDIKHKKIGIVKNSAVADLLRLKYPGINLVETQSVNDGVFKVSSGELFGFVNTSAAVNYAISKNGMTNLKVASKAGIDYYLRIAVRNDDNRLLGVLDSAILSLDAKKIKDVKAKWLFVKVEQSVDYSIVWKILGGFGIILTIIGVFLIKQNQLKRQIEDQKKAFEDLYQKSTDPILLIEGDKFVDCNEATIKILGYSTKEEFLNMHPSKLSPMFQGDGKSSFEMANLYIKETNNEGFRHFEWIHTKANGENFWVDVILTKININNKDIIHVVWRDIQERKEIERELREQKEQFEKILSHIPVPVLIVSKESKNILFANNYASEVYKLSVDNLEGHNIDIIYTEDNQRDNILKAVDENGVLINYETTYKASDGTHIDALLSLIPIKFEDQKANLGVITDVTHLKEIQKALELESQKAKEATSAKSDFLAKMSHEIRTPMNAILGMLYLVEKTQLNSMQENYIFKANSAAKALLNIIDDILDISKIEAGKLTLEYKNFTFNDMLHEVMGIMSYKAEEKGLELLAYYDQSIPKIVKSDKLRIGQILNNLISNAIKFTAKGEVVVSTKLIKQELNSVTLMFCVKDSGIGISKEAQERLFQDFSQGDNTITRKYGGTGLGLSISKKLSQMLGGRIWIEESSENIGTTFCFTITCEYDKQDQKQSYYFPPQINDIKTLIIDDNPVAADVLSSMLKGFGFRVDIVHSGNDGYKAIIDSVEDYDIVFLDYKMPELNGIDTYKKIKTIKQRAIPKTIMVTAYSQNEIITQSKKVGIDGYLIKPAAPSTLYDTIVDVLDPNTTNNSEIVVQNSYESIDFNGIKCLLVEDNELNQDFAKELLTNANIKVDIANDGIEALSLVRNKSYDVVFMDIQMPNMDGLTAARHIRQMANDDIYFANIPIIALSANALKEDKEKSIDAGMNEHISKPIIPNELFDTLGKYKECSYLDNTDQKESIKLDHEIDKDILDVDEVLDRIDGNYSTYTKLLQKFAKKYTTVDQEIREHINKGNLDEASKKVHEVKGVAGNLGAHKVFDKLSLLNQDLRENKAPSYKLQEEFSEALYEVINFILNNIEDEENKKIEFDKDSVLKGLYFIKENIEDDIMACSEEFENLTPYFNNSKYEVKFTQALEEYNEFDTDSMLVTVNELIEDIE